MAGSSAFPKSGARLWSWVPDDGADGDWRREGVKRMQAVARNCRNQSL
jgi:hypothetical protein